MAPTRCQPQDSSEDFWVNKGPPKAPRTTGFYRPETPDPRKLMEKGFRRCPKAALALPNSL